MKVDLVANRDIVMDGQSFTSGDVVGTIETDLPPDCLQSLAQVCVLSFQPSGKQTKPEPRVPKRRAPVVEPTVDDADDDLTASDSNAEPFAGLTPKIAESLEKSGFNTVAKVKAYVAQGNDLVDLPGIGKAAKNQILAWLETV